MAASEDFTTLVPEVDKVSVILNQGMQTEGLHDHVSAKLESLEDEDAFIDVVHVRHTATQGFLALIVGRDALVLSPGAYRSLNGIIKRVAHLSTLSKSTDSE